MKNNNKKTAISCYLFVVILLFSPWVSCEEQNEALNLSVEDLLNVEVTSVAKKAQSLNDAPAAAFVISNEDIKRSGATSMPDALRLAPGLDVAKIDSNKWAVSSRGFNGRFANKLLVLIIVTTPELEAARPHPRTRGTGRERATAACLHSVFFQTIEHILPCRQCRRHHSLRVHICRANLW